MTLENTALQIRDAKESIVLIYAFNSVGKTRLSVAYKDLTKAINSGQHAGVYYNAFSEDLFIWDNDEVNDGSNIVLKVIPSNLNSYHKFITEKTIEEKLAPYNPKYIFYFNLNEDPEKGIENIMFQSNDTNIQIKISRGEERIFIWCFFLALFDVEGWADEKNEHFFIDDPVSSLDDHNIFITAATVYDLIETHYEKRKIIITTHHMGFATILSDWLTKGEKADKYKNATKQFILESDGDEFDLVNPRGSVLLYHLHLMRLLEEANTNNLLFNYHFALLRQVLENISSFLGVGQFAYVLEQIGITDTEKVANIVNDLSHKKVYYYQPALMVKDSRDTFREIFNGLKKKYNFVLHAE